MELRTSRLLLRDFSLGDIDAVHAYQSDPRYLGHTPWQTRSRAEVDDFIRLMVAWSLARPRVKYQLAIMYDALLIGSCGVRKAAPDATEAEFGCEVAPAAWGHGYAAEASHAILAFGFTELRLRRIYAYTTTANSAAIALARRLGMREEANVRQAGASHDTIALGISERRWNDGVSPSLDA